MLKSGACAAVEWTPEPRPDARDAREVGADGPVPLPADGVDPPSAGAPTESLSRREGE